jgi:hypothetical protein
MKLRGLFLSITTFLLAGCGGLLQDSATAGKQAGNDAFVVVAVIDTAFNPYHEFFYHGPNSPIYEDHAPTSVTPAVLAAVGVTSDRIIEVTRTGNISRDKQTDKAQWDKVRRGRPYWFKGTNVIGVSYCPPGLPMLMPDPGKNTHGVGTSAAVLSANPEAVVILVEFCGQIGSPDSEAYAFTHPAVDIISTSYGYATPVLGTPPLPLPLAGAEAYDGVVNMGKLHFQSGGNGPGFTPAMGGQGQWWTVGVSGSEEYSSNGQQVMSSNYADFVSDFTQELPYCQDCERGLNPRVPGTSFSCPRAAGVASKVLLEARRLSGHVGGIRGPDKNFVMVEGATANITAWDLRRALEEAAYTGYGIADYDPVAMTGDPWPSVPVNDAAPWLQLGWGDLTSDPDKGVIPEALGHLGFGTPNRFKGQDYCEYMAANMRFRQSYWEAVATASMTGLVIPDPNPYRYCDSELPLDSAPIPTDVSSPVVVPDTGLPQCTAAQLDPTDPANTGPECASAT